MLGKVILFKAKQKSTDAESRVKLCRKILNEQIISDICLGNKNW